MSKFNTTATKPATGRSPIATDTTPSGVTGEGAPGYARDAKSELFLLAVANMVGERTFYEKAGDRDGRYERLIHKVAVADPDWTAAFLGWLRSDGNMRSASLVGGLEAAKAMLAAEIPGSRKLVSSVLQRADEPGEALAYWTSRHGRTVPKPVKRGVADAVGRLYNEYALLKYDTDSKGFRFADVIDLVHPDATAPWQGDLFKYALDRRHGRDSDLPESLRMVRSNAGLRAFAATGEMSYLLDPDRLREAGMTWEDALSLAGTKVDKGKLWSALIPTMGYMALLRNLRNFDEHGVPDAIAQKVADRLANPEQVAKSRQFPFRFLSAYKAAPSLRWGHALEKALQASLANVPELPGRTLVLVDRSGSMFDRASGRSELTRAEQAAVFGAALALRNVGRTDLVEFGSTFRAVPVGAGDSLLRIVNERFHDLGGTDTASAMRGSYRNHDRVLIVTDEQSHDGNPGGVVPATVPVYTWNLAGYQYGHGPGAANRHTFAGMTDAAFRMVPLLEAGKNGTWPWESAA